MKIATLGSRLPVGAGKLVPVQANAAVEPVPHVTPQEAPGQGSGHPAASGTPSEQSDEWLTPAEITSRFAWAQGFFRSAIESLAAAKAEAAASDEDRKRSREASAAYRRRETLRDEADQSVDSQLDLSV